MYITRKQQAELTLVELMIGLLVGTIIIAGGLRVFTVVIRGQSDNVKLTLLNQDMRAIMVRDIRRGGFVTSYPENNLSSLKNNPFFDVTTIAATTNIAVHDTGSCLVYSYNRDEEEGNGTASPVGVETTLVVDSNERLGFRLSTGELKMRKYGETNEDCGTGSEWESISESEVEITVLEFTVTEKELNVTSMTTDVNPVDGIMDGDDDVDGLCDVGETCTTCVTGESCLIVRNVAITLTGQLSKEPTITQTIKAFVRIRNDKFVEQFP